MDHEGLNSVEYKIEGYEKNYLYTRFYLSYKVNF